MTRLATCALVLLLAACAVPGGAEDASGPAARWIDASGLSGPGFGRVVFAARDGNRLTAWVYRGRSFDASSGPIWFVLHGASRDAERYVRAAAPVAERYGALLVVPHFDKDAYPKGSDYTLRFGLHAEIERLFEAVRQSLGGGQRGYYLFGHSAGAQFTHRLLTFLPDARALGAVAANAGWYTLPSDEDPRRHAMPYGLIGSPVKPSDLRGFFAMPFVVLLGERDTTTAQTDDLVRGTPEADAQGATRLERGRFYFGVAEAKAKEMNAPFGWRLATVPRAAHDAARVVDSAGFLLFAPGETPCAPSGAAQAEGLVITEILADPPPGLAGDANGDGERDPSGDEFVEIVNAGRTPVCLTGFALGDAEEPERHVFPLGRALGPGRALVVFGGGVPTGRFGDAEVQRSAGGLSLSNAGDVITLRDPSDVVVRQVSWGDGAGAPRAEEHWPSALDIAGSLVRASAPGGRFKGHPEIDGVRYSPGRSEREEER